ncbi:AfsA-related hotdog domain-containing protein [Dactylosporangium sp. NPDC000521]|uniref:AfsA-related hotdog domain-containing protein n=1 Tax=Dactylosporangium sp. NPDC000521 TaxID=3363975 RepID=UPI0036CEC3E7
MDHLPGNLLVAGLLGLAGDVTGGELRRPDRRLRLGFAFPAFGELEGDVELHCGGAGDTLELAAIQSVGGTTRDICRGTVTVLPEPALLEPVLPEVAAATPAAEPAAGSGRGGTATLAAPAERALAAPADPKLVHRADLSTVMLGAPTETEDGEITCAVLRCPALAAPGDLRDPIEVIEAARQLVLMLGHLANGHAFDTHVVWIDLAADIPAAPPAGLPLRVSWRRPPGKARPRTAFDMGLHAGAADLGTVRLVTHTMSPAAYRKVRSA